MPYDPDSGSIPSLFDDGTPKLLLASEVTLSGLDRHVPEQELNLVQFATGKVAEWGAGATQVVWSKPLECLREQQRL